MNEIIDCKFLKRLLIVYYYMIYLKRIKFTYNLIVLFIIIKLLEFN